MRTFISMSMIPVWSLNLPPPSSSPVFLPGPRGPRGRPPSPPPANSSCPTATCTRTSGVLVSGKPTQRPQRPSRATNAVDRHTTAGRRWAPKLGPRGSPRTDPRDVTHFPPAAVVSSCTRPPVTNAPIPVSARPLTCGHPGSRALNNHAERQQGSRGAAATGRTRERRGSAGTPATEGLRAPYAPNSAAVCFDRPM